MKNNNEPEIPLGLGMALAMNQDAMKRFISMDTKQKQQVIARTHDIKSRDEMHRYVQQIADNEISFIG